jgi:hypothetical protein
MGLSPTGKMWCVIALVLGVGAWGEQPPFPVMDSNYFSYGVGANNPMAPKALTPLDADYFQSKSGDLRDPKPPAAPSRRQGRGKKEVRCTSVYGPNPTAQANFLAQTINQLCGGPPSVHFRVSELRTYPTNLNPYNPSYGQQRPSQQSNFDGTYVVCCPPKVLETRHPLVEESASVR